MNEIVKSKSEEQKNVIKNIKTLYESQEKIIKLFNDYSQIVSEAKYKTIYQEECSSDLAPVAKVFDHTQLKIITLKQMLQRLPIALVQIKPGNTSENLQNELRQPYILCIEQKKLLKKYITI